MKTIQQFIQEGVELRKEMREGIRQGQDVNKAELDAAQAYINSPEHYATLGKLGSKDTPLYERE